MPYVSICFAQNSHWPGNVNAKCKDDFFKKQFNVFGEGDCKFVLSEKDLTAEKLLPPHKCREDS